MCDDFFGFEKLRISSEDAIIIMPIIEIRSGCSFSISIQLKIAPETGIKNFQMLRIDTFTFGRFSKANQIEIAAADKKLNHPSAAK